MSPFLAPAQSPPASRRYWAVEDWGGATFRGSCRHRRPAPTQNPRTGTRHRARLNARRGCHCLVPEVRRKPGSSCLPGCKGCRALHGTASPSGHGTRLRRATWHTELHGITNASGKYNGGLPGTPAPERMPTPDRLVNGTIPSESYFAGKGNCMRRIPALFCLLLLGVTTGCDFFVPVNPCTDCTTTGDYLYVANGNNTFLAGFGVSTAGALSILTN